MTRANFSDGKAGQLNFGTILRDDRYLKARLEDGEYVLGVRPDHLFVDEGEPLFSWPGQVRYLERLGPETLIHIKTEDKNGVSLIPGLTKDLDSDATVRMSVRRGKAHLFHAENGTRVQK